MDKNNKNRIDNKFDEVIENIKSRAEEITSTVKSNSISEKVIIEFPESYNIDDIVEKAKIDWKNEHPDEIISKVEVYIKVNEKKIYCVVNENSFDFKINEVKK